MAVSCNSWNFAQPNPPLNDPTNLFITHPTPAWPTPPLNDNPTPPLNDTPHPTPAWHTPPHPFMTHHIPHPCMTTPPHSFMTHPTPPLHDRPHPSMTDPSSMTHPTPPPFIMHPSPPHPFIMHPTPPHPFIMHPTPPLHNAPHPTPPFNDTPIYIQHCHLSWLKKLCPCSYTSPQNQSWIFETLWVIIFWVRVTCKMLNVNWEKIQSIILSVTCHGLRNFPLLIHIPLYPFVNFR